MKIEVEKMKKMEERQLKRDNLLQGFCEEEKGRKWKKKQEHERKESQTTKQVQQ